MNMRLNSACSVLHSCHVAGVHTIWAATVLRLIDADLHMWFHSTCFAICTLFLRFFSAADASIAANATHSIAAYKSALLSYTRAAPLEHFASLPLRLFACLFVWIIGFSFAALNCLSKLPMRKHLELIEWLIARFVRLIDWTVQWQPLKSVWLTKCSVLLAIFMQLQFIERLH